MGSDIQALIESGESADSVIAFGCTCYQIAVKMFSAVFTQDMLRERLITLTRAIEMHLNADSISKEIEDDLYNWSEQATRIYLENSHFIGKFEGEKLKDTMLHLHDRIGDKDLKVMIKSVSKALEAIER